MKIAKYLDNFIINIDCGLRARVIGERGNWRIIKWETGAIWWTGKGERIWVRRYIDYPIKDKENIKDFKMPDPDDLSRYEGLEKRYKVLH